MARQGSGGREGRRMSDAWVVGVVGLWVGVMVGWSGPARAMGDEGVDPSPAPAVISASPSNSLSRAAWRSIQLDANAKPPNARVAVAWGMQTQPLETRTVPLPSAGWAGLILLIVITTYRRRHNGAPPVRYQS